MSQIREAILSQFSFDGKFKFLREVQVGKAPAGVAMSTVNREVYISNTESSEIRVIDVDSVKVKKTIDLNGSSLGVAVSPDGKRLFVSDWFNNCLLIIQLDSQQSRCIQVGKAPREFLFRKKITKYTLLAGIAILYS